MRKVILYIAASIDNYIARKDGSVDWLDGVPNPKKSDYGYYSMYNSIETTLMGNKTYQEVLGFDVPFPYPDKINFVFTRNHKEPDGDVEYVSKDPVAFTKELKNQRGKAIWLIGGGEINTLLLNAGLVDELIITRIPTILGEGIPLFGSGVKESSLQLTELLDFKNGIVQLKYQPKN
ncbi:MAG: dihydrofolate reductase [Cyclobacteriaceae bacterium]